MADYIYLLENRLSAAQQKALLAVREIARAKGLTVFLVGGAVRDLTSGSPVRDLDIAVQGNALKLKKEIEKAGGTITGEYDPGQALFVRFPGSVRMEIGSTLTAHYPKPGKPVLKPATILEDLRRRDFTANAMALSLNEGSYGLLMDPLNGVADIENRELRLVSNYGFIEDPVRMIRAARFMARLGWQLEAKTQQRYETGKTEDYIAAMQDFSRGYETEEIVHEEDPLRVMRRLESEAWMKHLSPVWSSAKVNVAELEKLGEAQRQLQMQGIVADISAAQFPLLTAKLSAKEVAELKKSFPRPGFVAEIEALEGEAKQFAAELGSKHAALPSAAFKLIAAARPEVVLWVAYSTRSAALQAKFASFYTEWPQARQKVPYTLMQEMRIVPELPEYNDLVEKLVFELMDGKLGTVEEMKAFLEPYSPPAPPPPVHLRRARATKKDAKAKKKKAAEALAEAESADGELPDEPIELDAADLEGIEPDAIDADDEASDEPDEEEPVAVKASAKKKAAPAPSAKPVETKVAEPKKAAPPAKSGKPVAVKAPVKAVAEKKAAPVKAPIKPAAKVAEKKPATKAPAKKTAPAKAAAKPAAKKAAANKAGANRPAAKKAVAKKTAAAPAKGKVSKSAAVKSPAKVAAKVAAKPPVRSSAKAATKSVTKPVAKIPAKLAGNPGAKPAAKPVAKGSAGKAPAKAAAKKKR